MWMQNGLFAIDVRSLLLYNPFSEFIYSGRSYFQTRQSFWFASLTTDNQTKVRASGFYILILIEVIYYIFVSNERILTSKGFSFDWTRFLTEKTFGLLLEIGAATFEMSLISTETCTFDLLMPSRLVRKKHLFLLKTESLHALLGSSIATIKQYERC
eukprot:snap_masked-scaffold_50-processed-gene-0.35-mRNA-1 protein AED:1.00 eAED:1.00 QI:0/0/0/0/1/1/4/0/156